jgi:predicted O-methyltransferase YrrM
MIKMNLNEYLNLNNMTVTEGFSDQNPRQTELLKSIVSDDNVTTILEIGFNAGHSADSFLSANPNTYLVSFDIGSHNYVNVGKKYIDETYPDRHELIIGDSLITVPDYYKKNKQKFDIIFIDGGHEYNTAKNDILNCRHMSHENTIVIVDDIVKDKHKMAHWNEGPTTSWNESIETGIICELGYECFTPGRGQCWGKYIK